ncbi:hypothetical protein UFOVP1229_73 [uncultured Caudovirales phage]|uniref:Uncharacterized protein n=1 Tax=uncultured Caudovirales phage TaxID=2100421 RepID=A0A6J5RIQ3_9CAUD|nr:hypothetical protein UFOVP1229_73 [uncultured Caudovirales phage]
MKISDKIAFTSRDDQSSGSTLVSAKLIVSVNRKVSLHALGRGTAEFEKNTATLKTEMTRDLIRTIQPRNEFEAAFAELRRKVQSCESLTMGDQMSILNSIADLHEKTLLQ